VSKKLHLYVWEGVLTDYTAGIMFALAESPEEARVLIRKKHGEKIWSCEIDQEPRCVDLPEGFIVFGGG